MTYTYYYVAKLKGWIPLDDPIVVETSPALSTIFRMGMTNNFLALSHHSEVEGRGKVRVWYI